MQVKNNEESATLILPENFKSKNNYTKTLNPKNNNIEVVTCKPDLSLNSITPIHI